MGFNSGLKGLMKRSASYGHIGKRFKFLADLS
jgi:hypothetical protein